MNEQTSPLPHPETPPRDTRLVGERNLPNLAQRPLQPLAVLRHSLAAADCMSVCMDEGYEGLSVPSKTYYAIGAGGAQVAVSHPSTQLTALAEGHGCGARALPSRPGPLADVVRRLHRTRPVLEQ